MNSFEVNLNSRYFLIHIDSSRVIGAVVSFNSDIKKIQVEFKTSKSFVFDNSNINNLQKAIEKVNSSLLEYVKILDVYDIDYTFVFLTAPWAQKNISTLVDERPLEFEVTEKYLEHLLGQAGEVKKDEVVLSPDITSVVVNGYDVTLGQVLNKEVTKLEVSVLDTTISQKLVTMISKLIKSQFVGMEVGFYGFLPVYLEQIKNIYNISNDFIFLNFTGAFSEMGVVVDGTIESMSAIPFGFDSFLEKIVVAKIAKNISEADYLLNLFLLEKLDKKMTKKINILIKKEKVSLNDFIKKNIFSNIFIPKNVFLITHNSKNVFLFERLGLFEDIIVVDRSLLRDFVDFDKDDFDNFIALESGYIFKQ